MDVAFAHYIVDIYNVGKSVHDVDGWSIIGGETGAIARHRPGGAEGATRDLEAGRAHVVRNYSSKKRRVHIGNRIGNAVGTVAGGQHQAVSSVGHRDHGRAGHTPELVSHVVALALIGAEEESFVLDNGPAHASSELLQCPGIFRTRRLPDRARIVGAVEVVARIHGSIASKNECSAVQSVGARLQPYVDHGTRLPAVFSGRILLQVEFLNGINGQNGRRIPRNTRAI